MGALYFVDDGILVDKTESAKWYRKAAEQGDVLAQFNLGVFYETGKGVPVDQEQAAIWYRKAAEQGHTDAQEALKRLEE